MLCTNGIQNSHDMERSTLLQHQTVAGPKGKTGGVTGICGRKTFEPIYRYDKMVRSTLLQHQTLAGPKGKIGGVIWIWSKTCLNQNNYMKKHTEKKSLGCSLYFKVRRFHICNRFFAIC